MYRCTVSIEKDLVFTRMALGQLEAIAFLQKRKSPVKNLCSGLIVKATVGTKELNFSALT